MVSHQANSNWPPQLHGFAKAWKMKRADTQDDMSFSFLHMLKAHFNASDDI